METPVSSVSQPTCTVHNRKSKVFVVRKKKGLKVTLQLIGSGFPQWLHLWGRRHQVWSLGREDSPGAGNGNPLQYYCLANPTDRGAWRGYSPQGRKELATAELLTHGWFHSPKFSSMYRYVQFHFSNVKRIPSIYYCFWQPSSPTWIVLQTRFSDEGKGRVMFCAHM